MPTSNNPANVPQTNYTNNQNYDTDVKSLFNDFISGGNATSDDGNTKGGASANIGIDDIRGQISANTTNQTTANLLTSLGFLGSAPPTTPNTTAPTQTVQESRCHAFYRIIGFPVVNASQSDFYNPGLDTVKGSAFTRTITLAKKATIAANSDPKFEALSQARENYANSTLQVFSNAQSVEAGVLALTSGSYSPSGGSVNLRLFTSTSFTSASGNMPFDYNLVNQSNPTNIISTSALVGDHPVLLSNFQDSNGNIPLTDISNGSVINPAIFSSHYHIIKPFTVDPRIDFAIGASESNSSRGTSQRVAVPFVPSPNYLKTSSTATATRPLIEKIISERFSQTTDLAATGMAVQNAAAYITNDPTISGLSFGGTSIGQIFSGNVLSASQQVAFADYLLQIESMIKSLVKALNAIKKVESRYYWLPQSSSFGPEGGGSVRSVALNANNINSTLITPNDFNIINAQVQSTFNTLTVSTTQTASVPDNGNFAFNGATPQISFNSDTSDAQGNVSGNTLDMLNSKRNADINKGIDALQTVEMIMGEFSGFGLCDVIAIMASLYVMDPNDLLGFLDTDSYSRAVDQLGDAIPSSNPSSVGVAIASLTDAAQSWYQIMDGIFQYYVSNNQLNL